MHIDVESIERATLAAVPPAALQEMPGWLLGLDSGTVGRAHSAVPLQHAAPDPAVVAQIEQCYAAHGLKPTFRLPLVASFESFRDALARRGYAPSQPTRVQVGSSHAVQQLPGGSPQGADLELAATPDEAWASVFLGEGFDPVDGANRVRLLGRAQDAVFASLRVDGRAVAAGAASFSHGWASIHGMRTALSHRGQGLASRILASLSSRAQARGITSVFLQVDAENTRAQDLYQRAGFATAWTYDYWRKP
ncbi:GNAT family N-acetyltransferase [Polaromonas sp. OV174]|uniref:GNAT family N-acetyltransferase n=1 Tax=Polaromonas sp. OV174 TaxID=1855300 RepID=UPI000B86C1AC|nr:GNAT family N-acetyltransferase [Polaromonas sp. OV174]